MPPTQSPGPAKYALRTLVGFQGHDTSSLKHRAPQWSMGIKVPTGVANKSPGPAALNILNYTRFGRNTAPAASMYRKNKELKLDFNPGPSHNPTDPSLYRFRYEPKYTMRTKTKALSADKGPGPDQKPADLDIYKNRAPRYPMGLKTKELKLDRIPAANAYDTAEGKTKVMIHYPAYSMRSKPGGLSRDKKPGPAEYDLKHHIPFDRMPAFSLRRKHSEYVHVPIVPLDNC